jgi:hypothetical protein
MLHHFLPRNEQHCLSAEIHLQHDLIIVQPPCHSSGIATSDRLGDTLLNGVVLLTSDPGIALWSVRIAFVVQYRYRLPGTSSWHDGIIYEHAKTFAHGGGLMGPSYNKSQDLIHRQLDVAILIPRDAPTFEILANAKVIPQIKVDVEFGHSTWSPRAISALPPSPPLYMDQMDESKTIAGHYFQTETWSGATVHPPSRESKFPEGGGLQQGKAEPYQLHSVHSYESGVHQYIAIHWLPIPAFKANLGQGIRYRFQSYYQWPSSRSSFHQGRRVGWYWCLEAVLVERFRGFFHFYTGP